MNRNRVLFVDDEAFFAEPYIRELERVVDVVLEESAIGAVDLVVSHDRWDAIILDIMMPSPNGKIGDTEDGLNTGLWILSEILTFVVLSNVPVIILTNRNIPRVKAFLEEAERKVGYPPELITVRPKIETPRFLLPRIVQKMIERFPPPPPQGVV